MSPIAVLLRSQMEKPSFLTRKHRQALKDAEEASCNRRGIHDIDFCLFNGNWEWVELRETVLQLARRESVLSIYIGISLGASWRWQDCEGYTAAEDADPMKAHKFRFSKMHPLTIEWSEPVVVMGEDLISAVQSSDVER